MDELGSRIRRIRAERGMTLQQLSSRTGLSVGFLSQMERGLSSPSIVSLQAICEALSIDMPQVFTPTKEPRTVTKQMDQPRIEIANSAVSYRYLSGEFSGRVNEILINEFPPGFKHPPARHEGEEFGYVLEGRLLLRFEDSSYSLEGGDSYHFSAGIPHGYETPEDGGAKALIVTTQKFIEWHGEMRRRAFEPGDPMGKLSGHRKE